MFLASLTKLVGGSHALHQWVAQLSGAQPNAMADLQAGQLIVAARNCPYGRISASSGFYATWVDLAFHYRDGWKLTTICECNGNEAAASAVLRYVGRGPRDHRQLAFGSNSIEQRKRIREHLACFTSLSIPTIEPWECR